MSKPLDVFKLQFNGHHLVEAAAGTGKTYNITALYVRALIEKNLKPSQILVLTFTNDATAELKDRIRLRIQSIIKAKESGLFDDNFTEKLSAQITSNQLDHLKACLSQFDEAAISTIHGFCQKILSEHHLDFGVSPNFTLATDVSELELEAVDMFWNDFFFSNSTKNEFGKWFQNKLNLEFKSPDKLFDSIGLLVRNTDILIDPEVGELTDFEDQFLKTSLVFDELQKCYEREREVLLEFYYSDALNKNSYRNKEQILTTFENWLSQENKSPKIYEKLNLFSEDVPNKYTKKGFNAPDLTLFKLVSSYISEYGKLNQIDTIFKRLAIHQIRIILKSLKKSRGILWYQDLLTSAKNGLSEFPSLSKKLAKRFPIAFIDEFQDTDHVQYSIFRSIYSDSKESCLVMIGDPKQAIYRFRGADLNTYLAAKKATDQGHVYTLRTNFRSSEKMIDAVNSLFSGVEEPFIMEGLTFKPAVFPDHKAKAEVKINNKNVAPFTLIEFDTEKKKADEIRLEIARSVSFEIVKLLEQKTRINDRFINQNDISVLVDTHRNAELIQEILLESGLRSTINSKSSVFHSEDSLELIRILHAIASPDNDGYIKSAMLTNMLNFDVQKIQALKELDAEWAEIRAKVLALNSIWLEKGLSEVFRNLESSFDVFQNLASTPNPERSITNYKHLKELLINAEREATLSINGILRYFSKKRTDTKSEAPEEEIVRLESDDSLIQIVTHHASKGLEYPIVFCPFLWNFLIKSDQIPIYSNGISQTAYLDKESQGFNNTKEINKSEEEAEKIRLSYVALTRAQQMCYLYHNNGVKSRRNSSFNAINRLINNNSQLDDLIRSGEKIHAKKIETTYLNYQSTEQKNSRSDRTIDFYRNDLFDFNRWFSFSSLTNKTVGNQNDDFLGFDFDENENETLEIDLEQNDRFSLPKGKATGNLLHNIFEQIDFTDSTAISDVIDQQLELHGFDEKWRLCLNELINDSISHDLINGCTLSNVGNKDKLVEMEFSFPIEKLDSSKLFKTLGYSFQETLSSNTGFMKGFIDLIFRYDGKYYILDYKSNHLGDSFDSYSSDKLEEEMRHAKYTIQYHIYLLAFLRFMKKSDPSFNYETDFGGVIYLFLRGINPLKPGSGVYFHKPELSLIENLDLLMEGEDIPQ